LSHRSPMLSVSIVQKTESAERRLRHCAVQAFDQFGVECPKDRISRKAVETRCGCPESAQLRPVQKTESAERRLRRGFSEQLEYAGEPIVQKTESAERRLRRVTQRCSERPHSDCPKDRISRKAVETCLGHVIEVRAVNLVQKTESAERRLRRAHDGAQQAVGAFGGPKDRISRKAVETNTIASHTLASVVSKRPNQPKGD